MLGRRFAKASRGLRNTSRRVRYNMGAERPSTCNKTSSLPCLCAHLWPLLTPLSILSPGGVQVGVLYGSPETTSGGNALKFYASARVDVRRK